MNWNNIGLVWMMYFYYGSTMCIDNAFDFVKYVVLTLIFMSLYMRILTEIYYISVR
jgi:hypothetical protein